MFLAVFVTALAFGTEPKFQVFPVKLSPAADGATMPGMLFIGLCRLNLPGVNGFPFNLFWIHPAHISASQEEKQEVGNGQKDGCPDGPGACCRCILCALILETMQ